MLAPALFFIFSIGSLALSADEEQAGLTEKEKIAWRLEMVEMDAALREIPSLITMEDIDLLKVRLKVFLESNVNESPHQGRNLISAKKKLKSKNLDGPYQTIGKEASHILTLLSVNNPQESPPDWNKIISSYGNIVQSCHTCHMNWGK